MAGTIKSAADAARRLQQLCAFLEHKLGVDVNLATKNSDITMKDPDADFRDLWTFTWMGDAGELLSMRYMQGSTSGHGESSNLALGYVDTRIV
jgi:hypothetical protein